MPLSCGASNASSTSSPVMWTPSDCLPGEPRHRYDLERSLSASGPAWVRIHSGTTRSRSTTPRARRPRSRRPFLMSTAAFSAGEQRVDFGRPRAPWQGMSCRRPGGAAEIVESLKNPGNPHMARGLRNPGNLYIAGFVDEFGARQIGSACVLPVRRISVLHAQENSRSVENKRIIICPEVLARNSQGPATLPRGISRRQGRHSRPARWRRGVIRIHPTMRELAGSYESSRRRAE